MNGCICNSDIHRIWLYKRLFNEISKQFCTNIGQRDILGIWYDGYSDKANIALNKFVVGYNFHKRWNGILGSKSKRVFRLGQIC